MKLQTLKTIIRMLKLTKSNHRHPGVYFNSGFAHAYSGKALTIEHIVDDEFWKELGEHDFINSSDVSFFLAMVRSKSYNIFPTAMSVDYPYNDMSSFFQSTVKQEGPKICLDYDSLCSLVNTLDNGEKGHKMLHIEILDKYLKLTLNEKKGLLIKGLIE